MKTKRLIKIISDGSGDSDMKIFQVLNIIMKKTKLNQSIDELCSESGSLASLVGLLNKKDGKYNALVLSILANCANNHQQTRKDVLHIYFIMLFKIDC